LKRRPAIHIKIDTGMHRQGFFSADMSAVIRMLMRFKIQPQGVFTHFASAKDPGDLRYARKQYAIFGGVTSEMERAGFHGMIRHAAASGGTLIFPESHLDMVRVGMGLYGYWPSAESQSRKVALQPVLTWKTIVSEIKSIPKGALVGYDGVERVRRPTRMAVLPVGYWHGIDRGLSGKGHVLIRGKRAKMLGRISMDMTVVDVTDISGTRQGDEVVLIGRQGKQVLSADEIGGVIHTTAYEVLVRINPLIRRVIMHDQ
ncbi:MAG: alanine racemase, partial [Patescibacteria group bacterium]